MNAVAKREETQVAVAAPPQTQGVLASDVIIPRILLMQGTSDFVKERKATLGDIVRSTTVEKLADPDSTLDFIPLSEPNATWIKEKRIKGAQRWEFAGIEPRNALNDGLEWKFNADKDGKPLDPSVESTHEWRRVKCLSLYAILPKDIEAYNAELKKAQDGEMPDLSKALTPVLVAFRSTSFHAGKDVSTFFTQAQQFKKQGYEFMLKLSCFLDTNDQGTYYVYKVDRNQPRAVSKEFIDQVRYWANIVRTTSLRIDETSENDDAQVGASANNF